LNHSEIVSFPLGVADLIRDTFKRGKYQDVILPLTCSGDWMRPSADQDEGLEIKRKFKGRLETWTPSSAGRSFAFYNTSRYDFEKLLADARTCRQPAELHRRFSPNMARVLGSSTLTTPSRSSMRPGSSSRCCERFKNVDLHPTRLTTPPWGRSSRSLSASSTRR